MVESAIHKGDSSSIKLHGLVVSVKLAKMNYRLKLVVSHVSGERMKEQWTDGVYREDLRGGVGASRAMIDYCPWYKDPYGNSPELELWLRSWAGDDVIFL